jgi:hypothetical protein
MKQELINALQTHESLLMRMMSKPDVETNKSTQKLYQELVNTQHERKLLQSKTAKN